MAMRMSNDDEAIVDINITPFVDVVLVLLVIFMVTAHFIVNRGMNLQLPKAASIEKIKRQKNFNISISKESKYSLDGRVVKLEDIKNAAITAVQSKEEVVVTLSADRGVVYDSVIRVMDELRLNGVSNFALQLEPEEK
ncbi:MAG: biopolymer transporter ExbD [Bdellovibrionota bacterium]